MRRAIALVAPFAAALMVLGLACSDPEPKRTWRPEDHGHPPQNEVDPERVPAGGSGAGSGTEPDEQAVGRAAAALWRISCASCHGADGHGGGPAAPPGAEMPDLTDPEWQSSTTDAEIARVIAQGQGLMPGFGGQVNPQGIEALVAHVRTLGPAEADARDAGSRSDGDATTGPDGGPPGLGRGHP